MRPLDLSDLDGDPRGQSRAFEEAQRAAHERQRDEHFQDEVRLRLASLEKTLTKMTTQFGTVLAHQSTSQSLPRLPLGGHAKTKKFDGQTRQIKMDDELHTGMQWAMLEARNDPQKALKAPDPFLTHDNEHEIKVNCCRQRARTITQSKQYEGLVFLVILANSVVIGIQAQYAADNPGQDMHTFETMGNAFGLVFLLELLLHIYADGFRPFYWSATNWWNWFDTLIVLAAVAEFCIELPHLLNGTDSAGSTTTNARAIRIVRTARLLRALRIGRIINFVMPLRALIYSMQVNLKMLYWAFILLLLVCYVLAVVLMPPVVDGAIGSSDDSCVTDGREYWGSLWISMLTLFHSISGGIDYREASLPLRRVGWAYEVIYLLYITGAVFAVLNVIVGNFCCTAIAASERDPQLVAMAEEGDRMKAEQITNLVFGKKAQRSNCVQLPHLEAAIVSPLICVQLHELNVDTEEVWALFQSLDHLGSGQVPRTDFVQGCMKLACSCSSLRLRHMDVSLRTLGKVVGELREDMQDLRHQSLDNSI